MRWSRNWISFLFVSQLPSVILLRRHTPSPISIANLSCAEVAAGPPSLSNVAQNVIFVFAILSWKLSKVTLSVTCYTFSSSIADRRTTLFFWRHQTGGVCRHYIGVRYDLLEISLASSCVLLPFQCQVEGRNSFSRSGCVWTSVSHIFSSNSCIKFCHW